METGAKGMALGLATLVAGAVLLLRATRDAGPRTGSLPSVGDATSRAGPDGTGLEHPVGDATAPERERRRAEPDRSRLVTREGRAEPSAEPCCVVGRVRDLEGVPVSGASVVARPARVENHTLWSLAVEDGAEPLRAKTDEEGAFRIEVPPAHELVLFAQRDLATSTETVNAWAGDTVELVLCPGATLRVRVLREDAKDAGAAGPVSGARVQVLAEAAGLSSAYWRADELADIDGEHVLRGVPRGTLTVSASAPGLADGTARVVSEGTGELACVVRLPEPGAVEGEVRDATTREPIANALVMAHGLGAVRTGEDGSFRLADLSPGASSYGLGAFADGYAPAYRYLKIASGRTERIAFLLDGTLRVFGRVVDDAGVGLPGAVVRWTGRIATEPFVGETQSGSVTSDGEGAFAIKELAPEVSYLLVVTARARGTGVFAAGPFARSAEKANLGTLALERPAAIRGRVEGLGAGERGLVRLYRADERPGARRDLAHAASARTDPAARFAFEELSSGAWELELALGDDEPACLRTVELTPGEVREVSFPARGPSIEGVVVDESGTPIEGCKATLLDGERVLRTSASAADGSLRIAVARDGPYRLVVEDPRLHYDSASVDRVVAGETGLRVVLPPFHSLHTIHGRLVATDGTVPERLYVSFTDATTGARLGRVALPDEHGNWEMRDLRDTPYDVELMDFGDAYEPVRVAGVRPSAEPLELSVRRRP